MFDTLQAQIGAAITVLVIALAFLKGDEPERVGGGAYALAWFASLLVQSDSGTQDTQWGLMGVDTVMLGVFARLAWKTDRAWPVWASALQSLIVMSHLLTLVDTRAPLLAFYVVINLASYGILIAIALGVRRAWRARRAAGLE